MLRATGARQPPGRLGGALAVPGGQEGNRHRRTTAQVRTVSMWYGGSWLAGRSERLP